MDLIVHDLGRIAYHPALERQLEAHARVLARRDTPDPHPGELLLLEHDPVITVSNRASAMENLLADDQTLARAGVVVARTDRGGDITYHGPGQLVAYAMLDLSRLNLGLHAYMRLLEQCAINVCGCFGIRALRDASATGVWVDPDAGADRPSPAAAKICAMGVRVRKWVTLHGMALNVDTNLEHFRLIVPCGLAGRPVTSLRALLGEQRPSMSEVKRVLARELDLLVREARESADQGRAHRHADHHPAPASPSDQR